VSVAEICARADVSERVFFNHFGTHEDAFLGLDRPTVDDEWATRYAADPSTPLITGAARLVKLPSIDPQTQLRRAAIIAAHPELLARAYSTLLPLRERCREIVAAAIVTRAPDASDDDRHILAALIVAAASELLTPGADLSATSAALDGMRDHLH